MKKKFKVIRRFVDKLDQSTTHEVDSIVTFDDKKDAERIEELLKHPKFEGAAFISELKDDEVTEYPHHIGGGTYELSNGEKVKGKEEALAAEEALK